MKIKSIYISQGMFCTERFFESGFNLIFSEKNSAGKTNLCVVFYMDLAILFQGQKSLKLKRVE